MFFMKFVQFLMFNKTCLICNCGNFAICLIGLIIFLYFLQVFFDLATRGNRDRHKLLCKEVGRNGHDHDWTSELHSAPDHQTSNEGDIRRQVTSQSCVKGSTFGDRLATCLVVLSKTARDNIFEKQAWSLVSF